MLDKRKHIYVALILVFSLVFSGCTKVEDLKVKMGMKNNDFEYIKQGKIQKIIIQSTRDTGFRFVVQDKKAIGDLYDILSTAKEAKGKSNLEPDYIFEMQESPSKIYKFNYIAGLDKEDLGNLYSDDKVYVVSKRLDNDIIKSFWNIRKPKDFNTIYYKNILDTLDDYLKKGDKNKTIGIDINEDIDVAKFIFSTDLEDFKSSLKDKSSKAELIEKPKDINSAEKEYDVNMTVKTQGYKADLYKAIITFWDKNEKKEINYYIRNQFKDGRWTNEISTNKLKDF